MLSSFSLLCSLLSTAVLLGALLLFNRSQPVPDTLPAPAATLPPAQIDLPLGPLPPGPTDYYELMNGEHYTLEVVNPC